MVYVCIHIIYTLSLHVHMHASTCMECTFNMHMDTHTHTQTHTETYTVNEHVPKRTKNTLADTCSHYSVLMHNIMLINLANSKNVH